MLWVLFCIDHANTRIYHVLRSGECLLNNYNNIFVSHNERTSKRKLLRTMLSKRLRTFHEVVIQNFIISPGGAAVMNIW
jgi:hypothetical protein